MKYSVMFGLIYLSCLSWKGHMKVVEVNPNSLTLQAGLSLDLKPELT